MVFTESASWVIDHPEGRQARLVHRLLSGAGRSSLTAYRVSPAPAQLIAHGLGADGALYVAAHRGVIRGNKAEVRMDIVREAPISQADVVVASVHLVGAVQWLDDADPNAPEDIHIAAMSIHTRIGRVTTDRVLLHDADGVSAWHAEELFMRRRPCFPARHEAFDTDDVVRMLPADHLRSWIAAVTEGRAPGHHLTDIRLSPETSPLVTAPVCLDVDEWGMTVLHRPETISENADTSRQGDSACVTFLRFPERVTSPAHLACAMERVAS